MPVELYRDEASWLGARDKRIQASEAPALLGHGYQSLLELWIKKTGRAYQGGDEPNRLRFDVGHDLEPRLQKVAEERLGLPLADPGDYTIFIDPECDYRAATLDRLALKPTKDVLELGPTERNAILMTWLDDKLPLKEVVEAPVELKTVAIHQRDAWQAEPTPYVLLQVQWQMLVTGLPKAWVAAIFGLGEDSGVYAVEAHPAIQTMLMEEAERFWKHVQNDTPPAADGTESARRALTSLFPKDSGKTITLSEPFLGIAEHRKQLKEILRAKQTELEELENRIRQAMGDATVAVVPGYPKAFRWQVEKRHEPAREARDLFPRVLREVAIPKGAVQ